MGQAPHFAHEELGSCLPQITQPITVRTGASSSPTFIALGTQHHALPWSPQLQLLAPPGTHPNCLQQLCKAYALALQPLSLLPIKTLLRCVSST